MSGQPDKTVTASPAGADLQRRIAELEQENAQFQRINESLMNRV